MSSLIDTVLWIVGTIKFHVCIWNLIVRTRKKELDRSEIKVTRFFPFVYSFLRVHLALKCEIETENILRERIRNTYPCPRLYATLIYYFQSWTRECSFVRSLNTFSVSHSRLKRERTESEQYHVLTSDISSLHIFLFLVVSGLNWRMK